MVLRSSFPINGLLAVRFVYKSWIHNLMVRRWGSVIHIMMNYISSSEGRLSGVVNIGVASHIVDLSHGVDRTLLIQEHSSRHIDYLRSWIWLIDKWVHWTAIALLKVLPTLIIGHFVWILRRQVRSSSPWKVTCRTIWTVHLAKVTHPIIGLTNETSPISSASSPMYRFELLKTLKLRTKVHFSNFTKWRLTGLSATELLLVLLNKLGMQVRLLCYLVVCSKPLVVLFSFTH